MEVLQTALADFTQTSSSFLHLHPPSSSVDMVILLKDEEGEVVGHREHVVHAVPRRFLPGLEQWLTACDIVTLR